MHDLVERFTEDRLEDQLDDLDAAAGIAVFLTGEEGHCDGLVVGWWVGPKRLFE